MPAHKLGSTYHLFAVETWLLRKLPHRAYDCILAEAKPPVKQSKFSGRRRLTRKKHKKKVKGDKAAAGSKADADAEAADAEEVLAGQQQVLGDLSQVFVRTPY